MNKHYLYTRVALADAAKFMLQRDDSVMRLREDGTADAVFYAYAADAAEARNLVERIRLFQHELGQAANSLETFIEGFDFSRPSGPPGLGEPQG